jgi:hypothetical protein
MTGDYVPKLKFEKLIMKTQILLENHRTDPAGGNIQAIQKRAYELYLKRGGHPGHELQDWLEAERVVREQSEIIQASRDSVTSSK